MDVRLQAALIAGAVSIIGTLIGIFLSLYREKLARDKFIQEQRRELAVKLYDRRLDVYPKAFDITEDLGHLKGKSHSQIVEINKVAADELRKWQRTDAALIMSAASVDTYYELLSQLGKQPARADGFEHKQHEKLRDVVTDFRSSLRRDIRMLHKSVGEDV